MLKKVFTLILAAFPFLFISAQINTNSIDWRTFLSQHDMIWDSIPANYYAGAISGNGLLGTNIYSDTVANAYRFDIGRSDVNEMRPGGHALYFRARLPIGHFLLTTKAPVVSEEMRVNLYDAITSGKLTTQNGSISFSSFVDASHNVIVVETNATKKELDFEFRWNPGKAISPRTEFSHTHQSTPPNYIAHPNPAPQMEGNNLCIQDLYSGYTYVTAWKEARQENKKTSKRTYYITVSFEKGTDKAIQTALNTLNDYETKPLDQRKIEHAAWWNNYYPASFVWFPDKKMESFYWIQQYKFACLTRADKNIIDLMGPWTNRTPWPAIWWNLNIQLTYSPLFTANRLELSEPVWNSLHKNIDNLKGNVPVKEWQEDAIAIGRSSSYDLYSPLRIDLVKENQYEVGNLTWLLYYYHQYCMYKNDEQELTERFYPLLKKSIAYYSHIIYKGSDGKYHLPLTASPEYKPAEDCNYDLSILRWGLTTLCDINKNYKLNDEKAQHWQDVLTHLTDYPIHREEGYLIGKDVSLTSSHRHYSHLLMIYPFRMVTPNTPENREVISKSLKHWIGQKGALQGYSFTGASSISSILHNGNDSYTFLKSLLDKYIQPNTLYKESGPVIETPLSAVTSLQEMYLQDKNDTICVFPSVPDRWPNASFIDFRAEKGILVSAKRMNGKTCFIQLKSPAETTVSIVTEFDSENLSVNRNTSPNTELKKFIYKGGVLTLNLSPDETVTINTAAYKADEKYFEYHNDDFSYGVRKKKK